MRPGRLIALALTGMTALVAPALAQSTAPATRPAYTIRRAAAPPALDGAWDGPDWGKAPAIGIAWFHPSSSAHRPKARVKLLYDDAGLYVHFRVEDRYVRSVHTKLHDPTSLDSAVEAFLEPLPVSPGPGRATASRYFCIETNCGGTFLFSLVEQGKAGQTKVSEEWMKKVRVYHSLPAVVDPEIAEPVTWTLAYFVPFGLLAHYLGAPVGPGHPWRANFYKVMESGGHTHYGAWQPIGDPLTFHKPEKFATLAFER